MQRPAYNASKLMMIIPYDRSLQSDCMYAWVLQWREVCEVDM